MAQLECTVRRIGRVGNSAVGNLIAAVGVGPGLGFALARKTALEGCQVALVSRRAGHLRDHFMDLNV
jgi:NAD(P)-dependent dehydrogenase (short-subunit alcohol dehydrogenase family)